MLWQKGFDQVRITQRGFFLAEFTFLPNVRYQLEWRDLGRRHVLRVQKVSPQTDGQGVRGEDREPKDWLHSGNSAAAHLSGSSEHSEATRSLSRWGEELQECQWHFFQYQRYSAIKLAVRIGFTGVPLVSVAHVHSPAVITRRRVAPENPKEEAFHRNWSSEDHEETGVGGELHAHPGCCTQGPQARGKFWEIVASAGHQWGKMWWMSEAENTNMEPWKCGKAVFFCGDSGKKTAFETFSDKAISCKTNLEKHTFRSTLETLNTWHAICALPCAHFNIDLFLVSKGAFASDFVSCFVESAVRRHDGQRRHPDSRFRVCAAEAREGGADDALLHAALRRPRGAQTRRRLRARVRRVVRSLEPRSHLGENCSAHAARYVEQHSEVFVFLPAKDNDWTNKILFHSSTPCWAGKLPFRAVVTGTAAQRQ